MPDNNYIDCNKMYYHYTNIDAFVNMLSGKKNQFRYTNCMFLNDKMEFDNLFSKIEIELFDAINSDEKFKMSREKFQELIKSIKRRTFVLSLSQNNTSIPMWELYSGKNGLCLGFKLLHSTKINEDETGIEMCDVKYGQDLVDSRRIIEIIKKGSKNQLENFDELFQVYMADLLRNCIFNKHQEFQYEYETRIVRTVTEGEYKNRVKFYSKNGSIFPFIEVSWGNLALKTIDISYANTSETIIDGLKLLLSGRGIEDVYIEKKKSNKRS